MVEHIHAHINTYTTQKDIHTENEIESKCSYIKILYKGQGVLVRPLNLLNLEAERVGSV